MIEKVARAMYEAQVGASVPEDLWAVTLAHPAFAGTLATARAAIQAMREPTQEMVTAGEDYTDSYYSEEDDFLKGWQAAIDAALGERS